MSTEDLITAVEESATKSLTLSTRLARYSAILNAASAVTQVDSSTPPQALTSFLAFQEYCTTFARSSATIPLPKADLSLPGILTTLKSRLSSRKMPELYLLSGLEPDTLGLDLPSPVLLAMSSAGELYTIALSAKDTSTAYPSRYFEYEKGFYLAVIKELFPAPVHIRGTPLPLDPTSPSFARYTKLDWKELQNALDRHITYSVASIVGASIPKTESSGDPVIDAARRQHTSLALTSAAHAGIGFGPPDQARFLYNRTARALLERHYEHLPPVAQFSADPWNTFGDAYTSAFRRKSPVTVNEYMTLIQSAQNLFGPVVAQALLSTLPPLDLAILSYSEAITFHKTQEDALAHYIHEVSSVLVDSVLKDYVTTRLPSHLTPETPTDDRLSYMLHAGTYNNYRQILPKTWLLIQQAIATLPENSTLASAKLALAETMRKNGMSQRDLCTDILDYYEAMMPERFLSAPAQLR